MFPPFEFHAIVHPQFLVPCAIPALTDETEVGSRRDGGITFLVIGFIFGADRLVELSFELADLSVSTVN